MERSRFFLPLHLTASEIIIYILGKQLLLGDGHDKWSSCVSREGAVSAEWDEA